LAEQVGEGQAGVDDVLHHHDITAGDVDRFKREAEALAALADAGATMVNLTFRHSSPAHYIEQLEAMPEIAGGI